MTSNFNVVITNSNFEKEISKFEHALQGASFISIDTEFSGLGYSKNLKLKYNFVAKLVKSRSLLQLGIAIFTEKETTTKTAAITSSSESIEQRSLTSSPTITELSSISISNSNKLDDFEIDNDYNDDNNNNNNDNQDVILNENKKRSLNSIENDKQQCQQHQHQHQQQAIQHFRYEVRMFTFLCLNQSEFQVFPTSMTFLAQHGFDFNKLFLDGIHLVTTKKHADLPPSSKQRRIIDLLSKHQQPLVIHNGFYDLLFLFQSFIDDLPDQLNVFIAKLTKVFPKIYDTKFLSEYKVTENRSYLQYLFMKYERSNYQRFISNQSYVTCDQVVGFDQDIQREPLINVKSSNSKQYDGTKICSDFANHGYCKNGINCKLSHDINIILDEDEKRKSMKPSTPTKNNNNNNSNSGNKTNSPATKKQKQDNSKINSPNKSTATTTTITISTGTTLGAPLSTPSDIEEGEQPMDKEEKEKEKENSTTNNNNNIDINNIQQQQQQPSQSQQAHSAGYDSAMTGFIFAYYQKFYHQ
ncbi:hypothetical protein PPL_00067 [Heterostelium album PN500]|uniref:C3H1-type domain-containing protein n=1 Tax=Heterostelium pallidum (strain ATCC 26659 / Pp 5 / PN500) TaxID=670386 RepID=D3BVR4_HETP5|nr:hypothetical protein PPL_00067 [Heterostelium album PN500]EFA74567.1 hypothetical protein PPL_00067 [Heterostelium album PN500]|eukprot:XP_020426701.1 hypothetical protein PPL_00067 [Heterostelium album PN500]